MQFYKKLVVVLFCTCLVSGLSYGQLSPLFYRQTCRKVHTIIREVILDVLKTDPRIAASLLRLHYLDCFVNGCDGSILLDNSSSIDSEKEASGIKNSARGFEVVDRMKSELEKSCPETVSCADILAIAATESVLLSGGPFWSVQVGRRDGTTASRTLAELLPHPSDDLFQLIRKFAAVGLNRDDLVTLSGAHTIGAAQCKTFMDRLYNFENSNSSDPTMGTGYAGSLRTICRQGGNDSVLVNLDAGTPDKFDNKYFRNILIHSGLLRSDQQLELIPTFSTVQLFSQAEFSFLGNFIISMTKMGNIATLTGTQGQIRLNCRKVNV